MKQEIRDIRIVFTIFSLIFLFIGYKNYPSISGYIFFILSPIIFICLLVSPLTLKPLFEAWIKVTGVVGRFNTKVILTGLFFLVFFPVGLIMRLTGNGLMKKGSKETGTYWQEYRIEGLDDKERYKKQF